MKSDNPFRDKLFHHELPVREENWQAIETRLPGKTEKKFPVFWILLFSSTVLGGAFMFGVLNHQLPQTNSAPQIESKSVPSEVASTTDIVQHSATASSDIESTTSIENQSRQNEKGETSSTINNYSASISSTSRNNNAPASSGSTAGKNNMVIPSAASLNSGKTDHHTNTAATTSAAIPVQTPQRSATAAVPQIKELPSVASLFVENTRDDWSTADVATLDVNPVKNTGVRNIKMAHHKPDLSCYKFTKKGGRYYFSTDFFVGPGIAPRSFSTPNGQSSIYSEARKSTEHGSYAWGAGARFNMHLHNGFAIRLGFLYDQAGDVFDYTDTLATRSTTRIDSFFSADGTFLYADTNRVLIFGTLIKQIHNTYRHLDVPILASYEIPVGRSTFMFNFGPVFNLTGTHRGQILDPMLIPREITPGQPGELPAYKTSLGIGLYFGAGALVPLAERFALLIEPRYLYRIKPVTTKSYPLEEKRHYAGLNFGFRYFLN